MNNASTITRTLGDVPRRLSKKFIPNLNSLARFLTIQAALEPCRVPVPVHIPAPRPRTIAGLLLIAALGMGGLASTASAKVSTMRDAVEGNLVNVQVLVDGSSTPLFVKPGTWDRTYFQAFKGKNYSLMVSNKTNERVGVLISVDGLNVVNGQRSRLANDEAMYVLDPHESTTIRGWRTSLNNIRRFVFVDEERSYASRTDQANGDMGWIRVLSFQERERRITWRTKPDIRDRNWIEGDARRESSSKAGEVAPAPSTSDLRADKSAGERMNMAPQNESAPGTGWGENRYDPVGRTQFTAAVRASDQMVLRYEYASGLRALGINIRQPRVFERERGEMGFAQPPRW